MGCCLKRYRLAEEIALSLITAYHFQENKLFLCFNSLSQGLYPQLLSHIYNGGNYKLRLRVRIQSLQEFHINLQYIKLIVLENIQGRIATAKVIHPYLVSSLTEAFYMPGKGSILITKCRFCNLHMQKLYRHIIFLPNGIHLCKNVTELKVQTRKIYRYRYTSPIHNLHLMYIVTYPI